MAEFQPLESLWKGASPAYPSEHSARWAVRTLRENLVKARAMAFHRNRLWVHPERFAAVAEQAALAKFSEHVGAS